MDIRLGNGAVPFVISYRKILKTPKVIRRRRFIGVSQLMKNILEKAIEFIEAVAFETETEVIDPGKSVAVHWAVHVEDPWDIQLGREANLIAFRMLDDKPPCGAHFEIISNTPDATPAEEKTQETGSNERPHPAYTPRRVLPLVPDVSTEEPPA